MKTKISKSELIRKAKAQYFEQHNRRAYNCRISFSPRYGGGTILLLIAGPKNDRKTAEIYF